MKVVKLVAPRRVNIFEEPMPELSLGQVLVQVASVGICGSDLHYFRHGGLGSHMKKLPVTLGHEVSGVVADPNKSRVFKRGDRVAVEPSLYCGICDYCERGLQHLCDHMKFLGSNGEGALQEFLTLYERQLTRIPDFVSFDQAVMLEPLGVAVHSVRRAGPNIGDIIGVYGVGTIGMLIVQVSKVLASSYIYCFDRLSYRLDFVRDNYGVEFTFSHPHDSGRIPQADISYDAIGAQESVDLCFKNTGKGGKVVLVGIPEVDHLVYNPHIARIKELTIYNSRRSNKTVQLSLDLLLQRKVSFNGMITHVYPVEKVQEAFEIATDYKDRVIKAVIHLV